MRRTENRRGLVQPARHTDHLGDMRQVGQLDSNTTVMDRQVDDVAVGVEELAEDVTDHTAVAQPARLLRVLVSHVDHGRVGPWGAHADERVPDVARLLQDLLYGRAPRARQPPARLWKP